MMPSIKVPGFTLQFWPGCCRALIAIQACWGLIYGKLPFTAVRNRLFYA